MAKCGWCKRSGLERRVDGNLETHTKPKTPEQLFITPNGENSRSTCRGPEDYYDSRSS